MLYTFTHRTFGSNLGRTLVRGFATAALLLGAVADAVTVRDADGKAVNITDTSRVVTLGGPITETVFALGAGQKVVAADSSSYYPSAVNALPKIGYQRALTAEGIISMRPTLVVGTEESGPPTTIQQLREAGLNVLILPRDHTPDSAKKTITALGQVFGKEARAHALNERLDIRLRSAAALASKANTKPKVMFIYARSGNAAQISGTGTAADGMIKLAGAKNVFANFEGYRPLTAEAAVTANPDYILMLSKGLSDVGGVNEVLKFPGIAQTNAGRNRRIVVMDDLYLLGFGPRLGDAVRDLSIKLHPELR